MISTIRRNNIKNLMLEKKNMTVTELADIFDVSCQTIRRDLHFLEDEGFVSVAYGGATLEKRVKAHISSQILKSIFVENKTRIAKKCNEFIHDGDCIFLDPSTTALHICDYITNKNITVITNSLNVLSQLSGYDNITLISTGGSFQHNSSCFLGRTAINSLSNYYVDKAFVSCSSLSIDKGLSDGDEQLADIRRLIIKNSNNVYIVADHTKYGKVSFVHICGFDDVDAIVVDNPLPEAWHSFCAENKINLYECVKEEEEDNKSSS